MNQMPATNLKVVTEATNSSEGQLSFVSGRDATGSPIEAVSGFSSTVIQKAFKEDAPVIVAGSDEGEAIGSRSAVVHNLRSIMAVPIKVKNQPIGVLYVDSSLAKGLFKNSDLDLLAAIGNQIGVAFEMDRSAKNEIEKQRLENELKIQAAIHEMSQKIKLLVDNMEQALFAVSKDKLIQGPVSKYTNQILGENLIGANVLDTLYKDIPKNSEVVGRITTTLETVFGEDSLQWELMTDNLPRKIEYLLAETRRIFSIKYSPVFDDANNLEKIAFVVDDVTELEILEKELAEKRKEALLIQELIGCDRGSLFSFLKHSKSLLEEFDNAKQKAPDFLARQLHTIKGNARLLGLISISGAYHELESAFLAKKDDPTFSSAEYLKLVADTGHEILKGFVSSTETLFGGTHDNTSLQVPVEQIEILQKAIEKIQAKIKDAEYENLKLLVNKLYEIPLAKSMSLYTKMVDELSRNLNKSIALKINCAADVSVPAKIDNLLRDCITHLIRNAADHGIDSRDERTKNNKSAEGTISIAITEDFSNLTVKISDDGRGIDPNKIAKIALERKLISITEVDHMSDSEKRNLILLPGFSSKEQASEISGRGIGMDVVKTNVEAAGGSLNLESIVNEGSTFTLVIPKYKS